jgi:hypothetical protein
LLRLPSHLHIANPQPTKALAYRLERTQRIGD